jgi:hypothetical protein
MISPAAGLRYVARTETAMGAVTRMVSSTTDSSDKATSSRGDPENRWLQRARISGPTAGMVAPLSADSASRLHAGAPSPTAARNPARLAVLATVAGASVRLLRYYGDQGLLAPARLPSGRPPVRGQCSGLAVSVAAGARRPSSVTAR